MLRIRLSRIGKKKQPAYRLVVTDSRSPRDGAFLKIIGHYNPLTDPATLVVKEDEAVHWLEKGARPSDTAAKLLTRVGVMEKAGKQPVRYQGKEVAPAPRARKGAEAPATAPPATAVAEAPEPEATPLSEPEPETEVAPEPAETEASTEPEAEAAQPEEGSAAEEGEVAEPAPAAEDAPEEQAESTE